MNVPTLDMGLFWALTPPNRLLYYEWARGPY